MRKLLSASFSRLWRNKEFWVCMGVMLAMAVGTLLNACRMAIRDAALYQQSVRCLDDYYFQFGLFIGGFCAIFSSLFLGTEYSDGTLRNKIIVGHTRTDIYLANLLVSFASTLLFLLAWAAGALVAVPTLGFWKMPADALLMYFAVALLFIAVFSAVFTAVAMLCSSKAYTVVISLVMFLVLMIISANVDNKLAEPEMNSSVEISAEGIQMGDPQPNPDYLSGAKREVYEFINDFLPTGQSIQMGYLKIAHPVRMILCSVFLTAAVTGGGLWAFRKKNLN